MASVQVSSRIMDRLQSCIPRFLRGDPAERARPHTLYDKDDLNRLLQDFTAQECPGESEEDPEVGVVADSAERNEQVAALLERLDLVFGTPDVLQELDESDRVLRLNLRRFLGFDEQSSLLAAKVLCGG